MDTTINPVSGTSQQYVPVIPKVHTSSSPSTTSPQDTVAAVQPAVSTTPGGTSPVPLDSQYEEAVRQAALSFKNTYAVSDQDFTIFKDATGKYITRYVSLRDGKVTYVPTPTLVKQLDLSGQSVTPNVAISA
jgi:hypothetical protein